MATPTVPDTAKTGAGTRSAATKTPGAKSTAAGTKPAGSGTRTAAAKASPAARPTLTATARPVAARQAAAKTVVARPTATANSARTVMAPAAAKTGSAHTASARSSGGRATPTMIGDYKVLEELARGGMGTVYKARHPKLNQIVIIKELILRRNSAMVRERFKREAQILLELNSPYVVRMYDYFTEGRYDYIVLEYVDGTDLARLLDVHQSLPPQLALLITLDVCVGLQGAHKKKIVHRDIKPANILLSKGSLVKLADFGIAGDDKEKDTLDKEKAAATDVTVIEEEGLTQQGTILGTPAYMSPEQLDDSRSVDNRADIYSLGVMLYQMVTGNRPFEGDMSIDTREKIMRGKYIPPQKLVEKKLPRIVKKLIKKMMHHDKDKRYQDVTPIIRNIKRYLYWYDKKSIRQTLQDMILSDKPIKDVSFELKHKRFFQVLAAVLALAVLSFAWCEGFFYRTILRYWYVPVNLTMEIPLNNQVEGANYSADLQGRAYFFENKEGIPQVRGLNGARDFIYVQDTKAAALRRIVARFRKPAATEPDAGTNLLKTRAVYLRPGAYRIKVLSGPYVWWKSLDIERGAARTITLDFLKNERRSLSIRMFAEDAVTGADISKQTRFQIEEGGKWVALTSAKASTLVTGKIVRVRALADGYAPEQFGLSIDWYQDTLYVVASLRPEQGGTGQ